MDIELLYKLFMDKLKDSTEDIAACYSSLFKIRRKAELQEELKYLYEVYKEEAHLPARENSWFYQFHKGIRQCGFFKSCSITYRQSLLNEDEVKELQSLADEINAEWKKVKNRELKVNSDLTIYRYFEKWNPVKYSRHKELKLKHVNNESDSINSNLDSVLWNLIHVDQKEFLRITLLRCFKQYGLEMEMIEELGEIEKNGKEK